jgi:hypothetical protein
MEISIVSALIFDFFDINIAPSKGICIETKIPKLYTYIMVVHTHKK